MTRRIAVTILAGLVALAASGCAIFQEGRPVRVERYAGTIRVACIGDSITYGAGIQDRGVNSYPAQLDRMLGGKWQVRNFGVNGATLLKKGDAPYWNQDAFAEATNFQPHVVVIMLGTNDTKPHNWRHKSDFTKDLADMIDHFSALESNPRIWLCLPPPAFPERWGIRDSVIREGVIPRIKEVASVKQTPIINMYKLLKGHEDLFPDKIHPNARGAKLMAEKVYKVLTGEKPKS